MAIAAADRPRHPSSASVKITDSEADAVVFNSAARLFHAAAAAIMGAAPGPVYKRVELPSGGNAPKSRVISVHPFLAVGVSNAGRLRHHGELDAVPRGTEAVTCAPGRSHRGH